MKHAFLLAIIYLGCILLPISAMALSGSANCHYELYTPENFQKPVVTPSFILNLSKVEFVSTEHPSIKRIVRLQTQPVALDGKTMSHIGFSQTYDGAHSGAIIPATNGQHVIMISKDGSDLVGAYLFCDVKVD